MLAIEDYFLNHYRLFSWLHCQTDICAFHLRNGWPWLPFSWATGRGKIWCFGPPSEHRFNTCFFCGMCFFHVSHCEINCNLGCGCVPTVEATCSFMLRGFGGLRISEAKLPTNHSWACWDMLGLCIALDKVTGALGYCSVLPILRGEVRWDPIWSDGFSSLWFASN